MRFFTRDLYRRCRSSDETVLDAACEEWERANADYERYLTSLQPSFPPQLREWSDLLLHDAKLLSIARQQELLLLVLQKEIPPRELVILCYDLDGEPIVEPFADAPAEWNRPTTFAFDEIEVVTEANRTLYCQSIVFSNGWEMRLRFHDVGITVAPSMNFTAASGPQSTLPLPHSA